MKKATAILAIIFFLSASYFIFLSNKSVPSKEVSKKPTPTLTKPQPQSIPQEKKNYLFVPYWTMDNRAIDSKAFDSLIYFGIAPGSDGIDKKDAGYKNISKFNREASPSAEKLLAVVMTDQDMNTKVFDDKNLEDKIIKESIEIAKNNNFSGIVLDFELSALSFQSVIDKVNSLHADFYKQAHSSNLSFYSAILGDSYYRGKPYDIKFISKNSDKIIIMSYNFHKSQGSPGPNFPYEGREIYGYDFKAMTDDFIKDAGIEKIVVAYGLFGYDWTVDEKSRAKKQASTFTLSQIKNKFIGKCSLNCSIQRDKASAETQIKYKDEEGNAHVVWFEDEESMNTKNEYLKTKGINQTAIWAYSYY